MDMYYTGVEKGILMRLTNLELFKTGVYINGVWTSTKETYAVINPSTLEKITDVAKCGAIETAAAIESASITFKTFKQTLAKERSAILKRISELMLANRQDLATILTMEQGKPLAEALTEVTYAASFFEWFAEEAKRIDGDVLPSVRPGVKMLVLKEPVGVVAAITPWNFPLAMFARKGAAAIAAGCTLVWKPSEETPLSANALAVIADMAGLPHGVLNIVSGNAVAIGETIMQAAAVKKITFTGSTKTGKLLLTGAANTVKRVSMELGGNAPFIVFPDADIDAAVKGAIASKFRNAGQTCICVNRFYIHADIYEEFMTQLTAAVKNLRVGDGFAPGVDVGPLINQAAIDKVERHVNDAITKGAKVLCGGKLHNPGGAHQCGTFYEPTVIRDMQGDMLIATEETFGPIAACFRFNTDLDVIEMANNTDFGLAAYFYTQNLNWVFKIAEALEYGMIGINEPMISNEVAPFGGVKQSGFGREGSKYGIDDYVNMKYIALGVK